MPNSKENLDKLSQPNLENIVSSKEKKHEVEAKCLVDRAQAEIFLKALETGENGEKKETKRYKIEQGWIQGGENDKVRLRRKTDLSTGEVTLFITKKTSDEDAKSNGYTNEQEEEVKLGDKAKNSFFKTEWEKIEKADSIGTAKIIRKERVEFKVDDKGTERLVELDLFEKSNLTLLEIEFKEEKNKEALAARDKFEYKKFFKKWRMDFVLIDHKDSTFKNRAMSRNLDFLSGGFTGTTEYKALEKMVKRRNLKIEIERAKIEAKAKKKAQEEERKQQKKVRKEAKKALKKNK